MIFLHLSDLHINRYAVGSPYDLDADLRTQLQEDVRRALEPVGMADGVLITGDVAFSGHHDEYVKASIWLERLTDLIGCARDRVWTVPGNHDVDRSVLAAYPAIKARHDKVRQCDIARLTDELREGLTVDSPGLLAPLANYATFASSYQCEVTPDKPFWSASLPATSGRDIVLCGITSPLISNETDDTGANRLALGMFQATIPNRPSDVVVTLSHHPPDWFRDCDAVEGLFDVRARLQLYGHKHTHRVRRINDSLRIHAGALHPERNETWRPRYNVIELHVAEPDRLQVRLHTRAWHQNTTTFEAEYLPNGEAAQNFELPLARVPAAARTEVQTATPALPATVEETAPVRAQSPDRLLSNRLGRLSHLNQLALGKRLGLLTEGERNLRSFALRNLLIERARASERLPELWRAASVYDETPESAPNPYVRGEGT